MFLPLNTSDENNMCSSKVCYIINAAPYLELRTILMASLSVTFPASSLLHALDAFIALSIDRHLLFKFST